jgi:hypothetical protein
MKKRGNESPRKLSRRGRRIGVRVSPGRFGYNAFGTPVERIEYIDWEEPLMRAAKRTFSILAAVAAIVLVGIAGYSHFAFPNAAANPSEPSSGTGISPSGNRTSPDVPSSSATTASAGGTGAEQSTAASSEASSAAADIDWRNLPVMPEVSRRAFEIYQDGLAQGRDPHHFSVIGDCQAIPLVFLGPYERGELEPDASETYLWDAIRQFQGSFSRSGMAVRGGFNAASILSPLQADPHYCRSGETPLTCEYRLHNPSFVFIMLETWLDPDTIGRYEDYLRQILDYVIGKGSVPILMTKADSAEMGNGVPVINPAIVRVAIEYDVPVINFWRSAQSLENGGIDPEREGFHLSEDGFKLKNILALRALYKTWMAVEKGDAPNAGGSSGTPTVSVLPSETAPSQAIGQFGVPDCDGGCIFAGTAVSRDGEVSSDGVLALNYQTGRITQVLGEGFDLQDASEDGQHLLVNDADNLYEIDLSNGSSRLVSGTFFSFGKQGAYWSADDSRILYLDRDHPIQTPTGDAFQIFPSARDGEIYFESGACARKAECQSGGVYRLGNDQTVTRMDSYSHLVFSPDGKWVAFLDPSAATKDNYFHIPFLLTEEVDRGAAGRRWLYFPAESGFMVNPEVREYAFSPDTDTLFILYDAYSDYYERSVRIHAYAYGISDRTLADFGEIAGASGSLNPRLVWSPREKKVLLFLVDTTVDDRFSLSIYQSETDTKAEIAPYAGDVVSSDDYFYVTNIYWR